MSASLPLAAALAAALSFGVASALQHVGATRAVAGRAPLMGLLGQVPYGAGLALDGAGFALTAVALQSLPLFAVEATGASSVAVTALLAARLTGERLGRGHRAALAGVVVGVGAVGLASPAGAPRPAPAAVCAVLLAAVPAVVATAGWAHRRRPAYGGLALGVLAGLAFAAFATACHQLPPGALASVPTAASSPLAWAGLAHLAVGLVCFAVGLQQGSATVLAAASTVAEVAVPAVLGVAFLGDAARPGWGAVAVLGLLAALAGTAVLASATAPRPGAAGTPEQAQPVDRAGHEAMGVVAVPCAMA